MKTILARIARSCNRPHTMKRVVEAERLTLSTFREQPGEYVRDVHRLGKRYLLTKSGKPVALLVPVDSVPGKDG